MTRFAPARLPVPLLIASAWIACGCVQPTAPPDRAGPGVGLSDAAPVFSDRTNEDPAAAAPQALTVEFSVVRVETEEGGLRRIERVWDFVDEQVLSAALALGLRDSGLRVGVGRGDARPAVRALLDDLPDRLAKEDRTRPSPARPLELILSHAAYPHTVFYVDRLGVSSGRTIADGRPILRLAYELKPPDWGEVAVRVLPEIRQPEGPLRWQRVGPDYVLLPEYRGVVYTDLEFRVSIPRDGFLLLGPTDDARRLPLLGRAFFVDLSDARRRESIYVISPVLGRAPGGAALGNRDGAGASASGDEVARKAAVP